MDDALSSLLISLLLGIEASGQDAIAPSFIWRWIGQGRFLPNLAEYLRSQSVFQSDILIAVAARAIDFTDDDAVLGALNTAAHRFVVGAAIGIGAGFDDLRRRTAHPRPIGAKRLDHSRHHQPLDIGPRRVMRPQLGALLRVQRAFEQGAEDGGFDLGPVSLGRFDQHIEFIGLKRNGAAILEQINVRI